MKVQKILKRLLHLHPKNIDLSLKRIKRLLKDLNNPENKLKNVIQVVGTNGKYSVCSTLKEIFETAGYTVNMNISPSLRKFNERYYLGGKFITDKQLYNLLTEVEKINNKKKITFHEFICACFFVAASRKKSDINIIEAGLFFRLDASNVFKKNMASVVMPIGIDHKDFLKKGNIDEIVYEKCSNLVTGSKIIVSKQKKNTLKKIQRYIIKNSSKKYIFSRDFNFEKNKENFIYKDKYGEINLPFPNLQGDFQIDNVCTAIATTRILKQFNITEKHIKNAINKIKGEGRLQTITKGNLRKYVSKDNKILIDGAHNVLAANAIKKYLETFDKKRKIIMILAMMNNKEHKKFLKIFKNIIYSVIALDIPNQINFIKKEKLSKISNSIGVPCKTENSIKNALKTISKNNDNAVIFCTGSLYFVGEILNLN